MQLEVELQVVVCLVTVLYAILTRFLLQICTYIYISYFNLFNVWLLF